MTIQITQTYTGAGVQAAFDTDTPKTLSFGIVADDPSIDADAEVQLTRGGRWFKAFQTLPNQEVKATNGPVVAIRLNIIALNLATTVDWEVCGENR